MRKPPPINWADVPSPDDERPMMLIVSAPTESFVDLVILSDHVEGVWTHWHEGRTIPCQSGQGCVCETMEIACRWKGYLGALLVHSRAIVLAEVTAGAARSAGLGPIDIHPVTLRGLPMRLRRARRDRTGKVVVELATAKRVPEDLLPRRPDVRHELARIWWSKR